MNVDIEYIAVCEAMMKAKEKFYEVIEGKYGYSGVFYSVDIRVTVLNVDLKPLYDTSLRDVLLQEVNEDG